MLGLAAVGLTGLAMLAWTWRAWPDPLIDFGRELYVPWRLAAGDVLYRDVAYLNGPLAPYWNSLWFRAFGASLMALVASNLLVLCALTELLYLLLRDIGTRIGATAACLVFMALFAFGQFLAVGNYNFVDPYSHDLTHGVLLSVVALFCVRRYQRRPRPVWIAAAGVAVGLLTLTKVEVVLAGVIAVGVALGLTLSMDRPSDRRRWRLGAVFLAGVAGPVVAALLLLSTAMGLRAAAHDALGQWLVAWGAGATSLPFYREGIGFDDAADNLRILAISALLYLAIFGPVAALALALRRRSTGRAAVALATFTVVAAVLGFCWRAIPWQYAARPLPLFMLAIIAATCAPLARARRRREGNHALVMRVSLAIFALVLLAKMALNARIPHYGFALAMPATLLLVVALVDWIPNGIEARGGYGAVFRGGAAAAILVASVAHLSAVDSHLRARTVEVASGADRFLADGRGILVNKALEELRLRSGTERTLAVFPEGAMINYLGRRLNPTPYTVFMPLEVALFGEDRMVASLAAHPPDYVMLVHRDTSEYGVQYFGRDYAQRIGAWIFANYRPITQIGATPFRDGRFGGLLMQRKDLG
jgi:4-amino-4-deoxy-L-arabinose transferase-like glycosyltransferase